MAASSRAGHAGAPGCVQRQNAQHARLVRGGSKQISVPARCAIGCTCSSAKYTLRARRSIRLSCCLLFFGLLGHSGLNSTLATELRQASNWAAITCVVVTAPLIGQVAEVSMYRTVGTILGGFAGFSVWSLGNVALGGFWASIVVVLLCPVLVTPTTWLAFKHSADQLTKFVQLTYVIVGFNSKPDKSAALLAFLRVSGIIAGGLLSLLLAVIILPRSATIESCRELKKALRALVELNQAVWALSTTPLPPEHTSKKKGLGGKKGSLVDRLDRLSLLPGMHKAGSGADLPGMSSGSAHSAVGAGTDGGPPSATQPRAATIVSHEPVEKLFTAVYSQLAKVESLLQLCNGELYITHFTSTAGTHFVFAPNWWASSLYGVNLAKQAAAGGQGDSGSAGRWKLPREDMHGVITILNRLARLLWALLLDFEDGLDATMQSVLHSYYPKELMNELALYMHLTLLDLANAWPNRSVIEIDNLMNLGQVVECLLDLSNVRARGGERSLRKRRTTTLTNTPRPGAPPPPPASPAPVPPPAPAEVRSSGGGSRSGGGGSGGGSKTLTLPFASRSLCPGEVALLELPPRRLTRALSLRASTVPPELAPIDAAEQGAAAGSSAFGAVATAALSAERRTPRLALTMAPIHEALGSPVSTAGTPGLPTPMPLSPSPLEVQLPPLSAFATAAASLPTPGSGGGAAEAPWPAALQIPAAPASPGAPETTERETQPLLGGLGDGGWRERPSPGPLRGWSLVMSRMDSLLPTMAAAAGPGAESMMFPATEEGYISQVRWHSLQWLLDEVVEELEEAFVAISGVMQKLPCPIT